MVETEPMALSRTSAASACRSREPDRIPAALAAIEAVWDGVKPLGEASVSRKTSTAFSRSPRRTWESARLPAAAHMISAFSLAMHSRQTASKSSSHASLAAMRASRESGSAKSRGAAASVLALIHA